VVHSKSSGGSSSPEARGARNTAVTAILLELIGECTKRVERVSLFQAKDRAVSALPGNGKRSRSGVVNPCSISKPRTGVVLGKDPCFEIAEAKCREILFALAYGLLTFACRICQQNVNYM